MGNLRRKMMKEDSKLIIRLAGLFLLSLSRFAYADADWTYKSKYSVSFPIIDKWDGSVTSESRYKNDMSDHYYSHLDVVLSYKCSNFLEVGCNYRYLTGKTKDGWKRENRPNINAKLKWNWADFVFSDNNRLEYRIIEDYEDMWRYKNKLKIEYPVEWTALKISPYVSEEIFWPGSKTPDF